MLVEVHLWLDQRRWRSQRPSTFTPASEPGFMQAREGRQRRNVLTHLSSSRILPDFLEQTGILSLGIMSRRHCVFVSIDRISRAADLGT